MGLACLLVILGGGKTRAQKPDPDKTALIEASTQDLRSPDILDSLAAAWQRYPDSLSRARSLFLQGLAATYRSRPEAAAEAFTASLQWLRPGQVTGDRFNWFVVQRNLGIALARSGDELGAETAFRRLLSTAERGGDTNLRAASAKSLAVLFVRQEQHDSAAAYFEYVLRFREKLPALALASSLNSLAVLYGQMDLEQRALSLWHEALRLIEVERDLQLATRLQENLGVAHRKMGAYDSSAWYLARAEQAARRSGSQRDWLAVQYNLLRLALEQGDRRRSEVLLGKLDSLHREIDADRRPLALLRAEWALLPEVQASAASELAFLRGQYAKLSIQQQLTYLLLQARFFEQNRQLDSALHYQRRYQKASEALQQQTRMEAVERVASRYQMQEREGMYLRQLRQRLSRQQLWLMALLAFSALLVFLLWRYIKNLKQQRRDLAEMRQQLEKRQQQAQRAAQAASPAAAKEAEPGPLQLRSKALVNPQDIVYLSTEGHYLKIHLSGQGAAEVERSSLAAFLERLPPDQFVRIHRSYAVNLARVRALFSDRVLVEGPSELPLSRSHKAGLRERLKAETNGASLD